MNNRLLLLLLILVIVSSCSKDEEIVPASELSEYEINVIDLPMACKRENKHVDEYLRLIKLLR